MTPPDAKSLPADCKPGDVLTGQVSFARTAALTEGAVRCKQYPLSWSVPPRGASTADAENKKAKDAEQRSKKTKNETQTSNATHTDDSDAVLKTAVGALGDSLARKLHAADDDAATALSARLVDAVFERQLQLLEAEAAKGAAAAGFEELARHLLELRHPRASIRGD